jgi:glucose-6-phosphate dehydrogenase assembly protein OpcA
MAMVIAFILGCLMMVWWKAKPHEQKSAKEVVSTGNQYVTKAISGLRTAEQRVTEIRACRVPKNPAIDDELREVLLEYMVEQIKKGKIKLIEDVD